MHAAPPAEEASPPDQHRPEPVPLTGGEGWSDSAGWTLLNQNVAFTAAWDVELAPTESNPQIPRIN